MLSPASVEVICRSSSPSAVGFELGALLNRVLRHRLPKLCDLQLALAALVRTVAFLETAVVKYLMRAHHLLSHKLRVSRALYRASIAIEVHR